MSIIKITVWLQFVVSKTIVVHLWESKTNFNLSNRYKGVLLYGGNPRVCAARRNTLNN